MHSASDHGDRSIQAKCLVCFGDIQRSQNNNEVHRESHMIDNKTPVSYIFG